MLDSTAIARHRSTDPAWRRAAQLCTAAFTLFDANALLACPDCWAGRQARFWFVHDRLTLHLIAALGPFLAVGLVAATFDAIGSRRVNRTTKASEGP